MQALEGAPDGALRSAILNHDRAAVVAALDAGANPNAVVPLPHKTRWLRGRLPALAVAVGASDVLSVLLDRGGRVLDGSEEAESDDEWGLMSPAVAAIDYNRKDLFLLLVDREPRLRDPSLELREPEARRARMLWQEIVRQSRGSWLIPLLEKNDPTVSSFSLTQNQAVALLEEEQVREVAVLQALADRVPDRLAFVEQAAASITYRACLNKTASTVSLAYRVALWALKNGGSLHGHRLQSANKRFSAGTALSHLSGLPCDETKGKDRGVWDAWVRAHGATASVGILDECLARAVEQGHEAAVSRLLDLRLTNHAGIPSTLPETQPGNPWFYEWLTGRLNNTESLESFVAVLRLLAGSGFGMTVRNASGEGALGRFLRHVITSDGPIAPRTGSAWAEAVCAVLLEEDAPFAAEEARERTGWLAACAPKTYAKWAEGELGRSVDATTPRRRLRL